jgi:hypothetical protein
MKPFPHVMLFIVFAIAGCNNVDLSASEMAEADPTANHHSPWGKIHSNDTIAVKAAKQACADDTRLKDLPPKPGGGSDPFTSCMKQQANKYFGKPAFEEICDAIPGASVDVTQRRCVTFDL